MSGVIRVTICHGDAEKGCDRINRIPKNPSSRSYCNPIPMNLGDPISCRVSPRIRIGWLLWIDKRLLHAGMSVVHAGCRGNVAHY